ncbi:MAG: hypothetical protein JXR76_14205 [Deltaproteobacteria bacterium]|nr:hypothetical protein [Deltaproteobacteria bacterium]
MCRRFLSILGLILWMIMWGCSDDKKTGKDTAGSDSGPGQGTDSATSAGTDSDTAADSDSATGGGDNGENLYGALGNTFRYGINGGHRNKSWGDDIQARLEARAGCTSQRISLPERHLDQWGYEIEVGDMQAYAALGMHSQVAFLTSPIRAHSTAPASAEDWELAYYIPKNLYEPVTTASGEINPENYWGKYVYDTVKIYSQWIKVWEIWNEPDWTDTWSFTQTWTESAPTKEQLPRFNGSIYEYIRMLRVSWEAARLADPAALIATGGIGYATFLNAILRYTDNPQDGSVTAAYPSTGGAYFDVLSFHHYPIYTPGHSDDAVAGYMNHVAELKAELGAAQKVVAGFENSETGAPRFVVQEYPGGAAYARNYILKVMMTAQSTGVHGIDWFTLSDSALPGASTNAYHYMGLFADVVDLNSIDEAQITETGIALATMSELLTDARADAAATAALTPVDGARGWVFVKDSGQRVLSFWGVLPDEGASSVNVTVPAGEYEVHYWDFSKTRQTESFNTATSETLAVGSTPVFLVSQ